MKSFAIHSLSSAVTKTARATSETIVSRNADLLARAGYVSQLGAGVYTLLPLGMRVLSNIEAIVRDEMSMIGAHECLMGTLQPREIWETTGRWDTVDVLYRLQSRNGSQYALGATAEEVITAAVAPLIQSYRDLPMALFQISTKYRDEHRARSGLLRGREFRMKDLYTFDTDEARLEKQYEEICEAYMRIFARCGLAGRVVRTFASGGIFSQFSDEFQLLADSGEDTIFMTEGRNVALNKEVAGDEEALTLLFGSTRPALTEHRAIEVANTFKLGSRFSDAFSIAPQDADGTSRRVMMACFGLGTTRLLGAVAELYNDAQGLVWPRAIAPYDLHLVTLGDDSRIAEFVATLSDHLRRAGISTLIDSRSEKRAGEKFADADLIGIPTRAVVGTKELEAGVIELRDRATGSISRVGLEQLATVISTS